jgi:hypothetical protein
MNHKDVGTVAEIRGKADPMENSGVANHFRVEIFGSSRELSLRLQAHSRRLMNPRREIERTIDDNWMKESHFVINPSFDGEESPTNPRVELEKSARSK